MLLDFIFKAHLNWFCSHKYSMVLLLSCQVKFGFLTVSHLICSEYGHLISCIIHADNTVELQSSVSDVFTSHLVLKQLQCDTDTVSCLICSTLYEVVVLCRSRVCICTNSSVNMCLSKLIINLH